MVSLGSGGLRTWHVLIGEFSMWRIATWRNLVDLSLNCKLVKRRGTEHS